MSTILHLTDLHLTIDDKATYGLRPADRLEAAIDRVVTDFSYADLVVFTGDITDEGDDAAYESFAAIVARLPMPWIATIGNHDRRDRFLAHFPQFGAGGFAQSRYALPDIDLLLLDTKEPDTHAGSFCALRRDWLEAELQRSDKPLMLCMHHHPMPMGIPVLDEIGLMGDSAPRLASALRPHRDRIACLLHGHTHRTTFANWNGVPVIGQRSQVHQASLALRDEIYVEDSGAALTVIRTEGSNMMAHHETVVRSPHLSNTTDRIAPVQ